MTDKTPAVSVVGATFAYSDDVRTALDSCSLRVERGEWIALVGPNGSGKSTLAKMINALLVPSQGACYVCGIDTKPEQNRAEVHRRAAMVFQDPDDQIVASVVEEDAAFGPENLGLPSEEIERRVSAALAATGLSEMRRNAVHTLSGGQKQRLALAGALALEPEILILDEASSMLDPEGRRALADCLGALSRDGMTIVQITHLHDEVLAADRVVVVRNGAVAVDCAPRDLFAADGKASLFGFDMPDEVRLERALADAGLISPSDEMPTAERLLDRLCL